MKSKYNQGTCVQIKFTPHDYDQMKAIANTHDIAITRLIRMAIGTFLKLYEEEAYKDSLIAGTFRISKADGCPSNVEIDFLKSILGVVESSELSLDN